MGCEMSTATSGTTVVVRVPTVAVHRNVVALNRNVVQFPQQLVQPLPIPERKQVSKTICRSRNHCKQFFFGKINPESPIQHRRQ